MSVDNPLADLSDDELVEHHATHGADNQYLTEMLRRLKTVVKEQSDSSTALARRLETLNAQLLWVTVAIGAMTLVQILLTAAQLYAAYKK